MTEDDLRRRFHASLGQFKDVRVFRRNVGKVRTAHGGMFISGIPGQADAYGFVLRDPWAVPFEIEFKGRRGALRPEQIHWQAWCRNWRVPYLLLAGTPSESDDEIIARWITEFSAFLEGL